MMKKVNFTENHPLGGKDVYSASKACSELILNAYSYSFYQSKKVRLQALDLEMLLEVVIGLKIELYPTL